MTKFDFDAEVAAGRIIVGPRMKGSSNGLMMHDFPDGTRKYKYRYSPEFDSVDEAEDWYNSHPEFHQALYDL